ncbi:cytochrome c [Novosphingobium sp. FSW06-99]|uniref:c-type cytochrome n=1 Tax=Novosphingobium sp. FSW06-99 TaxID=1739113 RepID=UPI00076C49B0|nr:cytochrome c [Novosphingobium sp. FSW06-99]KUR79722.1 cytochrome C [Novosphingobium sp. FSW06-99]
MKWALALIPAILITTGAQAQDGAAVFERCAACHTATGAGVPGAFPPLNRDVRTLAARPEGRRYLALVVMVGLIGPLQVEGQTFRNVMPAQSGLDAAAVAAVLNHVGTRISHDGPPFRAFSAAEVAGYAADPGKMGPADLAALHARLAP